MTEKYAELRLYAGITPRDDAKITEVRYVGEKEEALKEKGIGEQ